MAADKRRGARAPVRITLRSFLMGAAIALIISLTLFNLSRLGLFVFAAPDKWTYDLRHTFLADRAERTRDDIAIVLINEASLSRYPYEVPVDRGLLAMLVREISNANAAAIGLDFIIDRPSDRDDELVAAIKAAKVPVVIGALDERGGSKRDLRFQEDFLKRIGEPKPRNVRLGHLYLESRRPGQSGLDQTVRFIARPDLNDRGVRYPDSFAEQLVRASGREPRQVGSHIAWQQPLTATASSVFDISRIPIHDWTNARPEVVLPTAWRDNFKDRIVIIGGAFEDRDRHLTPFSVLDGARMSGVEVHSHIVAQLIDGRGFHSPTGWQELALLVAVSLLGFYLGRRPYFRTHKLLSDGLVILCLITAGMVAFMFRVILPSDTVFYAVIGSLLLGQNSDWLARQLPGAGAAAGAGSGAAAAGVEGSGPATEA